MAGADVLTALGEPGADRWQAWAAGLAEAFRASFWLPAGYPALALDAEKQPVDSLTSNIGHLLATGLLTEDEEALVAARLSGPDMNSGFGVRTMSASNAGYNPLSYHCGSVWSHDTAIVIRGLYRSGHGDAAARLADGLLSAAAAFDWRLPELFSGEDRGPVPYPAACRPQAWSAAAAGALAQALLGLDVDVPAGLVRMEPLPAADAEASAAGQAGVASAAGQAGASITGEVWRLPAVGFARFMSGLAVPMAIGRICLDDGRDVLGFLCEPAAVPGAADITRFGGWRAWIGRPATV